VQKNKTEEGDLETVQQVGASIQSKPRPVVPTSMFEQALYPVTSRLKPIDKEHPQVPINAYGESKLMFEHILDWYHKAFYMVVRLFNGVNTGAYFRIGKPG